MYKKYRTSKKGRVVSTGNRKQSTKRKRTLSIDSALNNPGLETEHVPKAETRISYSAPPSPYCPTMAGAEDNLSYAPEEGEVVSTDCSVSLSSDDDNLPNTDEETLDTISEGDEGLSGNKTTNHGCPDETIPPCIRLMVIENDFEVPVEKVNDHRKGETTKGTKLPCMKTGTLFVITCKGGSIGREGEGHEVLLDEEAGCSKNHATVTFESDKFYLKDSSSTNGTFLNGKVLKAGKLVEIGHGSVIRIGNTILKCHVHPGRETCLECEPGVITNSLSSKQNCSVTLSKSQKEKARKKEMRRLQNKYGVAGHVNPQDVITTNSYKNRAEDRRKDIGSDNPYEATQASSIDIAIDQNNKGFKMLAQMGWKKGQGLGSGSNQGIVNPIKVETRAERSGLGSSDRTPFRSGGSMQSLKDRKKEEMMEKIRQRFEKIKDVADDETNICNSGFEGQM